MCCILAAINKSHKTDGGLPWPFVLTRASRTMTKEHGVVFVNSTQKLKVGSTKANLS